MPSHDHTIELEDLCLQHLQLGAERGDTGAGDLRGNRLSAWSTAATPSSCSTPLRPTGATIPNSARSARMTLITEVCSANKQMTGTVQHQAALLLWRLGRDEPHIRPGDRFRRSPRRRWHRSYAASHTASRSAGGIRRTEWPIAWSSRDQMMRRGGGSIPTRHGGELLTKVIT